MKKAISLIITVALAGFAGCQSWPKDSYIQGAKSVVNTPWGPSTLEAEMIATGAAAKNISLPETPVQSTKKK